MKKENHVDKTVRRKRASAKKILAAVLILAALLTWHQPITFKDVQAGHWAYTYIKRAADLGFVSGYEDGRYGPDDQVTYAQFGVMLDKALYPDELASQAPMSYWWEGPAMVAHRHKLWWDTDMMDRRNWDGVANNPINREQMAQVLYNALKDNGTLPSASEIANAKATIGDFGAITGKNSEAVAACYATGLLAGSDGRFNPKSNMTRAQAAVVLCNVYGYVTGDVAGTGSPLKPYEPSEPVTPTQPVTPVTPVEPVTPSKPTGPKPSGALGGQYDTSVYNVPADTNKDGWITEAEVTAVINQFMAEHPLGSKWDESDEYSSPTWNIKGGGCTSFAMLLSDKIFGAENGLPKRNIYDAYEIRIGDIIRVFGTNAHWSVVHNIWWYDEDPSQGTIRDYSGNNSGLVWNGGTSFGDLESSVKPGSGVMIYTRFPQE